MHPLPYYPLTFFWSFSFQKEKDETKKDPLREGGRHKRARRRSQAARSRTNCDRRAATV